jgi:hypothetical protein
MTRTFWLCLSIALQLFALAIWGVPARTAEPPCYGVDTIVTHMKHLRPSASVRSVTGERFPRWLTAFNTEPPVTFMRADVVFVFSHPLEPTSFLLFGLGGCLAGSAQVSPQQMKRIETAADGVKI